MMDLSRNQWILIISVALVLAFLVVVQIRRGEKARARIEVSKKTPEESPYKDTPISKFVRENEHRAPAWVKWFKYLMFAFTLLGSMLAIVTPLVLIYLVYLDVTKGQLGSNTLVTALIGAVTFFYLHYINPVVTGRWLRRVHSKYLPGYEEVDRSWRESRR